MKTPEELYKIISRKNKELMDLKVKIVDLSFKNKELIEENVSLKTQLIIERDAKFTEMDNCEIICFNVDENIRHYLWKDPFSNGLILHRALHLETPSEPVPSKSMSND